MPSHLIPVIYPLNTISGIILGPKVGRPQFHGLKIRNWIPTDSFVPFGIFAVGLTFSRSEK